MEYLQTNVDITNLSNFKTKAKTKYYFEINSKSDVEKLSDIYSFTTQNNLWFLIIWAWTNMLFAFDEYNWVIVKNNLSGWEYDTNTKILTTYSNEKVRDIALSLEKDYNNDLWHRFIWLPWSIWWWVYWNAGCFWLELENNFLDIEVYDIKNWITKTLSKKEMEFWYRDSYLKKSKKYFIISIRFDLSKKVEKYSSEVDNIKFREEVQPVWNSAGSFFKNPSRDKSAWFLIEQVWLKGFTHWCAYFSEKHANFLMTNSDNWDYKDLLFLIEKAQNQVFDKFWINLINEVNIISN